MRNLILVFLMFITPITLLSIGQSDSLKIKLSKTWIIKGYEQFGVIDEPTEAQTNDKISFDPGSICTIVENGVKYKGTWALDNTRTYIICNLKGGAVKRTYKIISVQSDKAIIEYQTPDLIRTKYHMIPE